MLAFHNDATIKAKLIDALTAHAAADRIVQGHYWENGKGCTVACTLEPFNTGDAESGRHASYETILGIPHALARIEDRVFEGMQNAKAKDWPLRFASAIQPGADLSMVVPRFLFWLLSERLPKHIDKEKRPAAWRSVSDVAELYREWCEGGIKPSRERFQESRKAAAYAAYAADAADAAYAAYAAYAADAADAAYAAWERTRQDECALMSDKLVELLASAPIAAT